MSAKRNVNADDLIMAPGFDGIVIFASVNAKCHQLRLNLSQP